MPKKKEKSEVEHLRSENRKLTKEVKTLKRQLGSTKKKEHLYTDLAEREAEVLLKEEQLEREFIASDSCPNCGGKIEKVNLGVRELITCEQCEYRSSKKV